jgi:hypothetical protein
MLNSRPIILLLLTTYLVINGCGNNKSNGMKHNFMAEGTVKVSTKTGECQLWIMSSHTSAGVGFYPVNLDEQFRKNNLKIAFNFNDSRAHLSEHCEKLKAIVISEVKVLK